ncbi:MAG: polyphenol oxidase family protein, partial [Prevotella sp.]|nr:polyphenol oxidase family protein [Prevotella sp.]
EVGEEVTEAFRQAEFPMRDIGYRNPKSGKMHIDLRQANKLMLERVGVVPQHIEIADLCTYANPERFFSARRQTVYSGRMITGGILK